MMHMRATKLMGSDFQNSTIDSRVVTRCLNLQTPGSAYNIRRKVNDLMGSKSRVKLSRNTGASVITQAVSLRRNMCGICRKAVVDSKDDAFSARVTAKDGYTVSAPVSPKSNMLSWLRVSNLSYAQLVARLIIYSK